MLNTANRLVLPAPTRVRRSRSAAHFTFPGRGYTTEILVRVRGGRVHMLLARMDATTGQVRGISGRSWPLQGAEPLLAEDFREQVAALVGA